MSSGKYDTESYSLFSCTKQGCKSMKYIFRQTIDAAFSIVPILIGFNAGMYLKDIKSCYVGGDFVFTAVIPLIIITVYRFKYRKTVKQTERREMSFLNNKFRFILFGGTIRRF